MLTQRRNAREQKRLGRFLALSPKAEAYYQALAQRRLNPQHHVHKIVALSKIYGVEAVARALDDAFVFQAFSGEYIANLLESRQRRLPEPGALPLTRRQDLLDLELPEPDLSLSNRSSINTDSVTRSCFDKSDIIHHAIRDKIMFTFGFRSPVRSAFQLARFK